MTGTDSGDGEIPIEPDEVALAEAATRRGNDLPSAARVVDSALWSALASFVGAPILVVTTVLVARLLGVEGFGRFAYYTYLIALLTGLGDLGIGTALIRAGALAAGRGDEEGLLRLVRAGTTWCLVQIPWAVVVAWVVLPSTESAAIYAFAFACNQALLGPSHYLVMTSSLRWASQVRVMSIGSNTAGLLVTAVTTHDPAMTFAVGTLCTNLLTGIQIFALPQGQRLTALRPGRIHLTRRDVGFGFGTLLNAQLNGFVFSRSEVLFFRSGQAKDLGTFASAQTVSARSTLLIDVFFGSIPAALTSAGGRSAETLRRAFGRLSEAVGLLFACTAPIIAVLVVSVAPLLFGRGFGGVAAPALVLSLSSLFQSSMAPVLALRFAQRSITPMIAAGVLAAALDAALAATLVPRLGAAGAVIANASSGVLYLAVAVSTYLASAEWRQLMLAHLGRTAVPLAGAALVAAPLLLLSATSGLIIGVPLACAVSVVLLRSPGVRISDEGRAALLDVLPGRLRQPISRGLRYLAGESRSERAIG